MRSEWFYIAGDWGTTRLRLFLCQGEQVVSRIEGPGIAQCAPGGHAATLAQLTAEWQRAHGALPVWLAGMIGSRNGWRETSYVACPADAAALSASILHFVDAGQAIAITPGLSCTNLLGAPDLIELYRAVLAAHDITTLAIDAAHATLAGLRSLAAGACGPQSARVHAH